MFWEQRGHDLKKPKAYFSSRRGQAVPVKEAASSGGKEPEKTRDLTPLHLVCTYHGDSLPIFKAPCLIFVSTALLATLPGLTLSSLNSDPFPPGWSFKLSGLCRLLLATSHSYQVTYSSANTVS